ncbi:hypothetical protein AYO21_02632 [Fonsecaea monophora]|uniref:Major facilitator superfamily (MFS) profile domain-containing protein n=1 Tax=Fonsecaea monophora TaxID=254056 RepID=A0A177FFH0_9EURO|nr:hypothetical protein AYO21_02632 [Fonsecaea monophora]OAG43013.1 hypothetical protein AYO21_02632 [Fonsecaea monophora]
MSSEEIGDTTRLLPDSSESGTSQRSRWLFARLSAALLWGGFVTATDESFALAQNGQIASQFSQFRNSSLLIIVYAIVNTVSNPLSGKLGKLAQKQAKSQVVIASALLFGFGNVLCSISGRWPLILASRGIVGLGGAGLGLMATILWSDTQSLADLAIWHSYSVVAETLGWVAGGPTDRAVVISMFQVFEAFGGVLAITITSASLRLLTMAELRQRVGTDPASEKMFKHFLEDVDYLGSLPSDVREAMQAAYGVAARKCCLIALTSCIAAVLTAAILPRMQLDPENLRSGGDLQAEVASDSETDHIDT